MRYVLKFEAMKEVDVQGFIPLVGDFINAEYDGKEYLLKVSSRFFIMEFNRCICHCDVAKHPTA